MNDISSFFKETQEAFTIYAVERSFVSGRGLDYFKSFRGKENLIDTNAKIKKRLFKILQWFQKNIPNISELIEVCFLPKSTVSVIEAINAFNKLFSVHEHQAVGLDVIDPIIIQEGNVSEKYLAQMIALHEKSILQPVIIVMLQDDDFKRAKTLFSNCPHGINVKMIRNSGDAKIYKVINNGVHEIDAFISAFAQHCFSTCSHTPRKVLLNKEWSENSFLRYYSPSLLKIRTNLLYDEKDEVSADINDVISELENCEVSGLNDQKLLKSFECAAKLMRVFCHDSGLKDMQDAYQIAKELENDILLAQVYRYAYFFKKYSIKEQCELLEKAETIFNRNRMADQEIYCINNRLAYQFETNYINVRDFKKLQEKAIYDVPGLVGMSHVLSNTGAAYLMSGHPDEAIEYFDKGLDYAKNCQRGVQKAAILCNRMIAQSYCYEEISENHFRKTLNIIFDTMGTHKLPFISARLAMNIISIAFRQSEELGVELLKEYSLETLIRIGLQNNEMGSQQLKLQMQYLDNKYSSFKLYTPQLFKNGSDCVNGRQKEYIEKHGLNPFIFCTWL